MANRVDRAHFYLVMISLALVLFMGDWPFVDDWLIIGVEAIMVIKMVAKQVVELNNFVNFDSDWKLFFNQESYL